MIEKNHSRRPKSIIIDGNHLIHRAFYAIQADLKTSRGEFTNAIYGFASMLLNILALEKPDYIVVAFDEPGPTFRHDAYQGYKATRPKAPDQLYAQIPRIRDMVQRFGIPIFFKEGFEADDVMGTLAKQCESQDIITYIVTGDRDAFQLISPSIFVVFPHKGYREPIFFDDAKVYEKYGIHPNQMVDYKALMGDTSDNFKGVHGIGPKRAAELLAEHHTLEGIYNHLNDVSLTLRQKLEKGREDAFFSKKLAKIVTDVPCYFNPHLASFNTLNFREFSEFLKECEMESLQGRLKKIIPDDLSVSKDQLSLF